MPRVNSQSEVGESTALPPSLLSRNPVRWLAIFGPGAVIASLTIGVGELVFSSRGGALFGYRLLWYFMLVLALKWVLVFASARHIVLTGAHPFQRWMHLPGPRGWFPLVFFIFALVCFPIWVGFHAGTLGAFLSWLTGTEGAWHGGAYYLWGIVILAGVLVLSFAGGYQALERIQLLIVLLMLMSVAVALFFIHPDWLEFAKGLFIPQSLHYPEWISSHPEIASRPVWVETTTYVGVIGGSSYDYLAYVSYLRDKQWGRAGKSADSASPGTEPTSTDRLWLRAPLIDCTLSFVAVLIFTAVFLTCGAVVLGPQHKVPGGVNLLSLQAEFVTSVHPWLKYVYFSGALLAVLGTLYGTIEVAPTVVRELAIAFDPNRADRLARRLRFWSVAWAGFGGLLTLLGSFAHHLASFRNAGNSPGLIAMLTPANLFTGVLGCGLICLLNTWMDRRFLPPSSRMPWPLRFLGFAAGIIFLALGLKGYWDYRGWVAFSILAGTLALGWIVAALFARIAAHRKRSN